MTHYIQSNFSLCMGKGITAAFALLAFLSLQCLQAQVEICYNRIDDDGDGFVDCHDPECVEVSECWQCLTEFYQVHSNSKLVSLDPAIGTYSLLAEISGASEINGAQFNVVDGHVYAPVKINGVHKLGMLSRDGSVADTGLQLPGNAIFYVGAISADGLMYISNALGIHMIDLNAETLSVVDLGVSHPGVADFSLDKTNGLFYGIGGGGVLKVFNPFDLSVSSYNLAGSISSDSGGFGAAWSCVDGSFFAYNNSSGKIYSVNVQDLTSTEVLNGTGNLSINDGFNCVNASPPFEGNCGDGLDDDGDGNIDCADVDCFSSNQCTLEICNNGIDDDNDGWVDCSDSECYTLHGCFEICDNGIDDNGNGLTDGDDPQCGTSAGVTGGLESNRRLSDKIAERNFGTIVKNPKEYRRKLNGQIPFDKHAQRSQFDIAAMIPVDVLGASVAESTPINLTGITNADEVAAADYYVEENRIASVLAIYSEDGVYEHTKYICDRLDGARLLDISYLYAMDGNFVSYELLNKHGQLEYAVSFAAHYEEDSGFHIENHWNLHEFTQDVDFYNFQIWAQSYEDVITLLEATLEELKGTDDIASINHSAIPRVFVMQGDYQNGQLRLVVKNKIQSPSLSFHGNVRRAESGVSVPVSYEFELDGNSEQIITIETGYLYDIGAAITCPGSADDAIFLADGAWGVDNSHGGATVNSFEVHEQLEMPNEETYQVERAVSLSAEVDDYVNVYRSLDPNLNAIDLSYFNSLAFEAAGNGLLEVTLVKSSIEEWSDQFRTTLDLSEAGSEHILFSNDFDSESDQLEMNDINMIVFTLVGQQQGFESRSLELQNVRFQNSVASDISLLEAREHLSVYPNPVQDWMNFELPYSLEEPGLIVLRTADGKEILRKEIGKRATREQVNVAVAGLPEGLYYFEVVSGSNILGSGKFMKVE